ncbi:hypothetical protein HG535_0B05390 [Zygotorulaspora mrakii]|uniref:PHD-type domain-containing protein n=1 Tax=Zygotorulaspora mrakii TaxID=42260 RepID=A0A7H9AZ94_ZYGMR|nr:uncharacterized protein HG535_0B05390 [Zygotorulaspora mrakii]QLG71497.1 hypothetical protein HG535_0B05390 [Zygotorulaspora mrakii]
MLRGTSDDGPKLREEKQFQEFYSDLEKDTLFPVLVPKDGGFQENGIEISEADHIHHADSSNGSSEPKIHMKQIMFNGTVTLEPINLHVKKKSFKKTSIPISQLDSTQRVRSSRERASEKRKGPPGNSKRSKVDGQYITKFSKVGQHDERSILDPTLLVAVSKNLKNFQTEYDMDEQDDLYLQFLNDKYSKNKLSHEIFELLMSVLEREWCHLEKRIPPRKITTNTCSSDDHLHTGRLHYELYGSDDGTGKTSDQACAVCGGTDSDSSNAIVFCDGCDVAVHQECYGIVFIPEGQWLCRRCLVSKNRRVNCLFCPSHTGAFKQTDTGSWAHIVCGLWIPELYFANVHYMEPIEGVENISRSRWKLVCSICKQRMGACIQCAHKNCFTAFHVTCAKRAGLYLDYGGSSIAEVASNQIHSSHLPTAYCDKHAPANWARATEGILKTRRYFTEYNDINAESNLRERKGGSQYTQKKNIWKTNRGTPIAPHIFAEMLQRILVLLKIPNVQILSYNLCKYWSMKREMKRGASLVRKFDPSSYNILDEHQLLERLKVTDILLPDLFKLQKLTDLVRRRTLASNGISVADHNIQALIRYPDEYVTKHIVVDKFISSEPFQVLKNTLVNEEFRMKLLKWESCTLEDVTSFKEEIFKLLADLESSSTLSRAALGSVRKLNSVLIELLKHANFTNAKKFLIQDFAFSETQPELIEPRKWKGPYLKEEEGLSDVDELSAQDQRKLRQILIEKTDTK